MPVSGHHSEEPQDGSVRPPATSSQICSYLSAYPVRRFGNCPMRRHKQSPISQLLNVTFDISSKWVFSVLPGFIASVASVRTRVIIAAPHGQQTSCHQTTANSRGESRRDASL